MLFFSGCLSKKEIDISLKREYPSWYINPPQTTKTTLYAVGEAESRDAAVMDALNMMASTLSVSISSQFNSKKIVKAAERESVESTVSNEIQSSVKKIRISHYELLEAKELGFRKYIVLIKSDKKKLFESLKTEINQKFELADKELETLNSYNVIRELSIYKKVINNFLDVPNMLIIMNVLDDSFNAKDYLNRVKILNRGYEKLLSSISFSIVAREESKNLISPISHGLNVKKLQIKNIIDDKHVVIFIKSDIQKVLAYGFILARSAIEISIENNKGTVIGSNKLNIVGQSIHSYEAAKEGIAIKLNDMIKKEGVGKVLGLDL